MMNFPKMFKTAFLQKLLWMDASIVLTEEYKTVT